jgi:hypothetical protein
LRLKASLPKSNPVVVLPPPIPPLGPAVHCPLSTVHCPGHTPAPREQQRSIGSLVRPQTLCKNRRGKPPPHPVTISFLRYCVPGQVPCHSLPSLVFPCRRCVSSARRPPLGLPAASHREPPSPSVPKHPSTTPRAFQSRILAKVGRTRRLSLVTRHPGPARPPPLISPDTTLPVASQFIPPPAQSAGHEGPPALLSSTLANAFGEPF